MLQDAPELEAKALFEHLMPGKVLAMDWMDMNSAGITIGGALKHKLFHAVLPYSNSECASRR